MQEKLALEPQVKRYPLTEELLFQLKPGDIIKNVPMSIIIHALYDRVPGEALAKANAYGELGGDFNQHTRSLALNIAAKDYEGQLLVENNHPDKQKIRVKVIYPEGPSKGFWQKELKRESITLNFDYDALKRTNLLITLRKLFK